MLRADVEVGRCADPAPSRDRYPANSNIKNILVTGGAGFIGSFFVRKMVLSYPEYNIINLDKLDYCASSNNNKDIEHLPNYTFIKGDITIPDLVAFVVRQQKVDTIINFAAQTHVDRSFMNSYDFTKNNVMGTHVLAEVARVCNVYRFIHFSTDEVYGEGVSDGPDLGEQSHLAPTNPYAATKAAAEMIVQSYFKSFKLPAIITRCNNVYGPCQYPEKVIPKFINLLNKGRKCCLHGTGDNLRRYIYASDVADAVDTILHRGRVGELYNIGTDFEISNVELARMLVRELDLPGPADEHLEFVEDRAFNDLRYAIDTSKLQKLGWKPRVTFSDGIQATIDWYKKHGMTWWGDIGETVFVAHPTIVPSAR